MALFNTHLFSESLGMQTEVSVIIPQSSSGRQIGVKSAELRAQWPCLWLLHGLSDDHTIWCRRTSIERYAEEAGLAVVMPNAHRSFYCDMAYGGAYWTFISEELPTLIRQFFPISAAKKDNAVAGLSMGGYGAAKWLMRRPDCFHAGASLSGVMDIAARFRELKSNAEESFRLQALRLVFGERNPKGSEDDLFTLVSRLGSKGPPLLQICGTEDFLYEDNRHFRDHATSLGFPISYREGPGSHDWAYWDAEIQTVIRWLKEQGLGS